jgi:hypothetical protein
VEIAGLATLTGVVTSVVVHFVHFLGDRKVVRAVMAEEMREAREAQARSGLIKNKS